MIRSCLRCERSFATDNVAKLYCVFCTARHLNDNHKIQNKAYKERRKRGQSYDELVKKAYGKKPKPDWQTS